ncbi:MAG: FkbM family methyltransferase [bacterium]|nr:FkbM family methyltransferase [bacterium]
MNLRDLLKFHLVPTRWHMANVCRRLRKLEPEVAILPHLVAHDRIALDVGANKGGYTCTLLGLASAVHAFEPNPALIPWLSRLRDTRLTIHPLALGDCTGEALLRVPFGPSGRPSKQGATLAVTERTRNSRIEVPISVCRLDDLELGDIGFIKIDVEGFEARVIDGARETIARCRPAMLIEIEERHTGEPPSALIERIVALGYACYALSASVLTDWQAVELDRQSIFNWIFLPRAGRFATAS